MNIQPKWYFITDDTLNKKNIFLFWYINKVSNNKLVLLTPDYAPTNSFGYPQEIFHVSKSNFFPFLWAKFSYLISKTAYSSSDIQFPKRNIYNQVFLIDKIVNFLWKIKIYSGINKLLPNYETVFFSGIKADNYKLILNNECVYVFDSIILRSLKYPGILKYIRVKKFKTYGVIFSWDNPFYSQLYLDTNRKILWSEQMLKDLNNVHLRDIKIQESEIIGPYPFYNFFKSSQKFNFIESQKTYIGYACAFCDELFLNLELKLIKKIAQKLSQTGYQILVRPYPSLPLVNYESLNDCKNIKLYLPENTNYQDRFGDGREYILFSTDEERHYYLSQCMTFLSMGTSFTIEAAIDNIPIIHFYLDEKLRENEFELKLFERIDISDHITSYFNKNLEIAHTYDHLEDSINKIVSISNFKNSVLSRNQDLLDSLGFGVFREHMSSAEVIFLDEKLSEF